MGWFGSSATITLSSDEPVIRRGVLRPRREARVAAREDGGALLGAGQSERELDRVLARGERGHQRIAAGGIVELGHEAAHRPARAVSERHLGVERSGLRDAEPRLQSGEIARQRVLLQRAEELRARELGPARDVLDEALQRRPQRLARPPSLRRRLRPAMSRR
jgi:hypothetical protein